MPSLILYSGASYTGTSQLVAHGQTGELASAAALDYLSVGVDDMQAFCWSAVSSTQATDYQYHTESLISANIASLAALYPPDQTQYPMSYLGIDPAVATPVWLDMSQVSGDTNALAATSLVGGSSTSMTTLSRTGVDGMLAFIGLVGGSAVVATCSYGSYDETSGQVDWTAPNAGTLVLEYTGGTVVLLTATGFPDGWTFGAPKIQPDGSWKLAVSGAVAGNVISSLNASKETLMNDGTDTVTLTATITDGTTGRPVSGVSVNWYATLGNLSVDTSVTDASGQATARLTDSGDTGAIVVTAALDDGSQQDITIPLTDAAAGQTLVSLTSDKDSIVNDGTDAATLIATVHNADGSVAEGVTVTWRTTLGSLNHKKQDTTSGGVSKAKLTDSGDTGPATVTASLANGSQLTCVITVEEDKSAGYVVSALTSDRSGIGSDGTDTATLTAVIKDRDGAAVEGVTVSWSTTLGEVTPMSSDTALNGSAATWLTSEQAGTATVTARLANGNLQSTAVNVRPFVTGSENFDETEATDWQYAGYTQTFVSGLTLTVLEGYCILIPQSAQPELGIVYLYDCNGDEIHRTRFDIPGYAHSLDFVWGSFHTKLATMTFYDENDIEVGNITATHTADSGYTSESYTLQAGRYYAYFILSMHPDDNLALLDNLRWY